LLKNSHLAAVVMKKSPAFGGAFYVAGTVVALDQ